MTLVQQIDLESVVKVASAEQLMLSFSELQNEM